MNGSEYLVVFVFTFFLCLLLIIKYYNACVSPSKTSWWLYYESSKYLPEESINFYNQFNDYDSFNSYMEERYGDNWYSYRVNNWKLTLLQCYSDIIGGKIK